LFLDTPGYVQEAWKVLGSDLLFFLGDGRALVNQAPRASGLGPSGFDRSLVPRLSLNGPSARAVFEPQSRSRSICFTDATTTAGDRTICVLVGSADPPRRGLSALHFCLHKSCLGLCPRRGRTWPAYQVHSTPHYYTHTWSPVRIVPPGGASN